MIFIPTLLTYLTTYFKLPDIFANWEYSIITSLVLIIAILFYELNRLNKRYKLLSKRPDKRDKKIIRELLDALDLDEFQEDIYRQDAWYGYRKEAIGKSLDFKENVRLIKNKTTDLELNRLLNNFTNELQKFHEYSSVRLFGGANYYIPNKDTEEVLEISKKQTETMNQMTAVCFEQLELLMTYLRKRKYL